MTVVRREVGQTRLDDDAQDIVERTAREWSFDLDRDVTKRQAASALIKAGKKHDAEARKLLP